MCFFLWQMMRRIMDEAAKWPLSNVAVHTANVMYHERFCCDRNGTYYVGPFSKSHYFKRYTCHTVNFRRLFYAISGWRSDWDSNPSSPSAGLWYANHWTTGCYFIHVFKFRRISWGFMVWSLHNYRKTNRTILSAKTVNLVKRLQPTLCLFPSF